MSALESLYGAIRNALNGDIWDERVYSDIAPANTERPYVVFAWVGGGESNEVKAQDADFAISVKCIADTMQESMDGAQRIGALLNDAGLYDTLATVTGDAEWDILTITQNRVIHLKELFEGATPIYHDGYQFDVTMEAK